MPSEAGGNGTAGHPPREKGGRSGKLVGRITANITVDVGLLRGALELTIHKIGH